ncbi:MAG: hypothetical protein QW838_04255 [Candidatus Nitrosotenuis sp.]
MALAQAPAQAHRRPPGPRDIFERRREKGLLAPTPDFRFRLWRRLRCLAIAEGQSGYEPWEGFLRAHLSPAQFVLCSGSERVGKSLAAAAEAVCWIPFSERIWLCGQTYSHARKEFDYVSEFCLNLGWTTKAQIRRSHLRPSSIFVTIEGRHHCEIETRSLFDVGQALVAESPDLIVLCEAGLIDHDPLEAARMRLTTRRGRCFITGTVRNAAQWFLDAFERWRKWPNPELGFSIAIPLWANRQDFPGGRDNPEIANLRQTLPPSSFAERVAGRPQASELLVFAELFGRSSRPFNAKPCPFTPQDEEGRPIPVEIAIDPGYNPSYYTVHAIQRVGEEIWVIDEIARQKATHEEMIARARARPWWPQVQGGTIDPHGGSSHGQGYAYSPYDIWASEAGVSLRMSVRPEVDQLIERFWFYLRHPITGQCSLFFDPNVCPRLLTEFRRWRYQSGRDGHALARAPEKRWCDAIKGIGYWLVDDFQRRSTTFQLPRSRPLVRAWRLR